MPLSDRLALGFIALLALAFPVAWVTPLMTIKVRLVFWASGTEVTVLSTLQALWADDPVLALVLSLLTLVAPILKLLGAALILVRLLSPRVEGVLWWLGRFAMADVLLMVVYMALFKGLDGGTVTTGWGLWVYTGAVLGSLGLSMWLARREAALPGPPAQVTRGA